MCPASAVSRTQGRGTAQRVWEVGGSECRPVIERIGPLRAEIPSPKGRPLPTGLDGSYIAYSKVKGSNWQIKRADDNGKNRTVLATQSNGRPCALSDGHMRPAVQAHGGAIAGHIGRG